MSFHDETVPTAGEGKAEGKSIKIGELSWSQLALLKKKDPFMYFSITGAKEEVLYDLERDISNLNFETAKPKLKLNTNDTSDSSKQVKRQSRISCESHFSIFFEDFTQYEDAQARKKRRTSTSEKEESVAGNVNCQDAALD